MNLTDNIFAKRGTWQLFEAVGGHDLSTANSGHVDREGRLWLRIPDALLCTDGQHVIRYYTHDMLAGRDSDFEGFARDDKFWVVAGNSRLMSLDLGTGAVADHTSAFPPLGDAYWLWTFQHEDIVVGLPGKIYRYNGRQVSVLDVPGDTRGRIHSVRISPHGDLWLVSHLGLHSVEDGKLKLHRIPGVSTDELWEFMVTEDQTVWLPAEGRILRLEHGRVERIRSYDLGLPLNCNPHFIDDEKNVWGALLFRGTLCMNSSGFVLFPFEDTPGFSWPHCVVQDKTRSFWLIGVGNGIARYDPHGLDIIHRGYSEAAVIGKDGRLRIATASEGLIEYDGTDVKRLCDPIPDRCLALSVRDNGDISVSTPHSFLLFDAQRSKLLKPGEIPGLEAAAGRFSRTSEWDCKGGLWLNCPHTLYRCGPSGLKAYPHGELGISARIFIFKDSRGTLWFISNAISPVYQFGTDGFVRVHERLADWLGMADTKGCRCVGVDGEGGVWMKPLDGYLTRFCPDKGTVETMTQIAGSTPVRHIRVDTGGRRWISTNNGLYVHDGTNTYRMTETALLPSRRIVATHELEDGRILIVTELGLCEYRPNLEVFPQVSIAKVVADRIYETPVDPVVSEPEPVLSIYLTAVNMKPGPLQYQTRLLGRDDAWTDTWQEEFHFEDLPVGKYRFEARAIDQDLMTSREIAALDMVIIPDTHEVHIAELEGELRGAKDFAANIIRSINDAIIVLTIDGRIATANTAALELLGWAHPADLIGKPAAHLFPEVGTCLLDARGIERLRKEGHFPARELEVLTCDGSRLPVMFSASCMSDRNGRLQGFVLVASDISEYKALQAQMLQSQKMESLGVLAGGIAHDFNNLLGVMLGNADLALADTERNSDSGRRLAEIIAAGTQASKLCSEMLAYSGKGQHVREPLDLAKIVRHNADLLKSSISRKIAVDYDLQEDVPNVLGDEVQLMQIVLNLVINAAEAIGDKPGKISLSVSSRELAGPVIDSEFCSGAPNPGRYVLFAVNDSGCGMDRETLSRIFEPFFTTKFTGRGLGLSAIHGIVKSHGGAISVDSRPGAGTTFRIFLPAFTGQPAPAPAAEEKAPAPKSGTVLVVDDEAAVRAMTRLMLERQGLASIEAVDGLDGIDKLKRHRERIDLVLLDITMPQMDGLEAYQKMREISPGIPIIAISGYSESEIATRFPRDEHLHLLHKPFTLKQLGCKIAEAMPA